MRIIRRIGPRRIVIGNYLTIRYSWRHRQFSFTHAKNYFTTLWLGPFEIAWVISVHHSNPGDE